MDWQQLSRVSAKSLSQPYLELVDEPWDLLLAKLLQLSYSAVYIYTTRAGLGRGSKVNENACWL